MHDYQEKERRVGPSIIDDSCMQSSLFKWPFSLSTYGSPNVISVLIYPSTGGAWTTRMDHPITKSLITKTIHGPRGRSIDICSKVVNMCKNKAM